MFSAAAPAAPSTVPQVLRVRYCASLTDASLALLLSDCDVLAELDISGCPQLSSAALPALARGLQVRQSGLRVLRLAGCTFAECLDDCTLAAVLFAVPQLQVLDITGDRPHGAPMVASIGRITAGTGYEYLAKEVATSKHDYYAGRGEAPGVWKGSGLAELGLHGHVRERDMESLYGRFVDPRTSGGEEVVLGRRVTPRVMHAGTPREHAAEPLAALDVTFSPSKSVSALWAAHPSEGVRVSVIESPWVSWRL